MLLATRKGQEQMRRAAVAILIFAGAAPATAQVEAAMVRCAAKVEEGERLTCYDDIVRGLSAEAKRVSEAREKEAAVRAEAAAAAAAAKAAEQRKADFGRAGIEGFGGRDSDRIEQIEAGVTEILKDAGGKSIFVLDNGQIWRQVDGFGSSARVGTRVIVKRGTLGAYRLAVPGSNRVVQVIRMR
jgi:hypothetical protein